MRHGSKFALMLLVAPLAACGVRLSGPVEVSDGEAADTEPLSPDGWADARADLADSAGARTGEVQVKSAPAGVLMRIDVSGLAPGWHGVHFHQVGDCGDGANGFKNSGSHVDPGAREHGLLHQSGSEEGDLPNIYAGADGSARAELFRSGAALIGEGGLLDADGFAVIVHANADDQISQPIGGAGNRVACAALRP